MLSFVYGLKCIRFMPILVTIVPDFFFSPLLASNRFRNKNNSLFPTVHI